MKLSPGIFKGMYRGVPIYWDNDGYNADGSQHSCRTLAELHAGIDASLASEALRERDEHARKLADAKSFGLWAERDGDVVLLHTPDGDRSMSIRQYRNEVFDIEEKYDRDVVFA